MAKRANKGFFDKVYPIVEQIPEGCVMTYGQIAMVLGNPRAARIVGYAMMAAPEGLPCHRVVKKSGELCGDEVFGGHQRELLAKEGVPFLENGRIDLKQCLFWGAVE